MFYIRLALALGRSPRELMLSVSSDELAELMAYNRLEPFGYHADNWRAGLVAATFANVNRRKGQRPYTPQDFMPKADNSRNRGVNEAIKSFFRQYEKA